MNVAPKEIVRSVSQLIAEHRPVVLVFLPNGTEFQRFVLSGAFDELAKSYRLRFVVTSKDADLMRAAAPDLLRADSTYELDIGDDRYQKWCRIFELSCHVHALRSASFALRIGAKPLRQPEFEIRLLRASWSLAKRFRPVLGRIPSLRARWGKLSNADLKVIDKYIASDSWVRQLFGNGELKDQLQQSLASMRPYWPMMELLERVNPLFCVIPTSLLDTYCNDLFLAAEELGHTVLALQSGWDDLSSKGVINHYPAYLGVWGPQSADHAKTIQNVSSRNVVVLGAPHYWALVPAARDARARFRSDLGVSPDDLLILVSGSLHQFDGGALLNLLENAIEAGTSERKLKVLLYPPFAVGSQDEKNLLDSNWKHIIVAPGPRGRYGRSKAARASVEAAAPMDDTSYLARLLSSVDAVISPTSTLLIEALIIDKPTMAIAFGDGKQINDPAVSAQMTHLHKLKKLGILEWCERAEDLEKSVRNLLGRCGQPNDPDLRRRTLDAIVSLTDSSYSQRLDEFARMVLAPRAGIQRGKRDGRNRGRQSHAYHAHLILRDYCGLQEAKSVPGHWMHGWIPSNFNVHPLLVAIHKRPGFRAQQMALVIDEEKEKVVQWVSRPDQETYLRSEGYKHVKAIGLPFAYLPSIEEARIPGSLLVMPPHSHHTHGPGDPLAEAYADAIAAKRHEFSEIWVCLNVDDYTRNQWVEPFRKRNIPIFVGAEQGEERTLYRLKRLMSAFEYVTTNGFGSHIAYAAAAGAKVSVFGPFADCPRERMAKAWAPSVNPALTDLFVHLHTVASLRAVYPFLFVEPEKASTCEAWGRQQIGLDIRLQPGQLLDLFEWRESNSPDFKVELVNAARSTDRAGG